MQPATQVHGFRYFRGGHPTPNAESIQAASAILRALEAQPASALVIFLLSGGGSSIVEKPIDDEISLDDLIATYRALVLSGAPIAEINAVRKHLSAVKGGRLAQAAFPAQQVSLLVSDVPDSTPDALASGPTMPDSTTVEDCYRIAEKYGLLKQFPQSTRELFERHALEETRSRTIRRFSAPRWWTVLSNQTAIEEASISGRARGLHRARGQLLRRLGLRARRRIFAAASSRVEEAVFAGVFDFWRGSYGEGHEWRNGRTQSAVRAGVRGKNHGGEYHRSECGNGRNRRKQCGRRSTCGWHDFERARARGLDARAALDTFDAFPFFNALGDAIEIGPTGNNLRDLRILLAY